MVGRSWIDPEFEHAARCVVGTQHRALSQLTNVTDIDDLNAGIVQASPNLGHRIGRDLGHGLGYELLITFGDGHLVFPCKKQNIYWTLEKSGWRFSMNAANASCAAGSISRRPKLAPSSAICASTCALWPCFIKRLVSINAFKGRLASLRACNCATALA